MFTQNYHKAIGLTDEHKEYEFQILYYQFLKHAFGLKYCNNSNNPVGLKIFFDKLPDTNKKNEQFKQFIYNLQFHDSLKQGNLIIKKEDIAEVDSKKHIIMQCVDVVLGSIYFRLNDLHKEKPLH